MQQQNRPRLNIYGPIHEALRAQLCEVLTLSGRTDWQDPAHAAESAIRIQDLLEFCRAHIRHENAHLHTAIEARVAGASCHIEADHLTHERSIQALENLLAELCAAAGRADLAERLYRELALFVAHNFEHMEYEESFHHAALWAAYSDEELELIHDALVAALPPDEAASSMFWILRFVDPYTRAMILRDLRAKAPTFVFEATLAQLRPFLDARDAAKLDAALRETAPALQPAA